MYSYYFGHNWLSSLLMFTCLDDNGFYFLALIGLKLLYLKLYCYTVIYLFVKGKAKFVYSAVANPQDCSKRFTSLADLFNQTPSQLLWEASRHMLQLNA